MCRSREAFGGRVRQRIGCGKCCGGAFPAGQRLLPTALQLQHRRQLALRIAEVVVHHHDLDTAWTIEEADPDSLLNALEAAVRTMRAKGAPGMTLVTEERDEWVIGDGALRVESDREGLLGWLARGDDENVEADGPLPVLPSW